MTKLKDTAIIKDVYSMDPTKVFYQYEPGTVHLDENCVGRMIFVKDFVYLDENYNKCIMTLSKDNIEEWVTKYTKEGRNVFAGPHAPQRETQYGDYEPYLDPNKMSIWERPTKEELEKYKRIIERQKEEAKQVMKKKLA